MNELRPVEVEGSGRGLFHRWYVFNTVTPPSMMVGGAPGGQESRLIGVVELENGEVIRAAPGDIRFLDTAEKMKILFQKEDKS